MNKEIESAEKGSQINESELPFYKPQGNEVALFEYAWRNHLPVLILKLNSHTRKLDVVL